MISQKMIPLVNNSSVIRAMFEEGKKMAAEVGAENVYDFSIGNPNVPAPAEVKDALIDLLQNENPVKVHGYMVKATQKNKIFFVNTHKKLLTSL
jgi:Aspartate/tyrosine/aromatic aminotransferase